MESSKKQPAYKLGIYTVPSRPGMSRDSTNWAFILSRPVPGCPGTEGILSRVPGQAFCCPVERSSAIPRASFEDSLVRNQPVYTLTA